MNKTYHFIAGLPRSGSTLLSAILNQNPKFHAEISSPLDQYVSEIIKSTHFDPGWRSCVSEEKMKKIIESLFDAYYDDVKKPVCFNTGRSWTNQFNVIDKVYPDAKIICTVRDISEIINSFEWVHSQNPFNIPVAYGPFISDTRDEPIFVNNSVYSRANRNLKLLEDKLFSLKEMCFGPFNHKMMLVEYKHLCEDPDKTISEIYNFLGESDYKHDFNNIEFSDVEYDKLMNAPGMHTVKKTIINKNRQLILPYDIIQKCNGLEFWRNFNFT